MVARCSGRYPSPVNFTVSQEVSQANAILTVLNGHQVAEINFFNFGNKNKEVFSPVHSSIVNGIISLIICFLFTELTLT